MAGSAKAKATVKPAKLHVAKKASSEEIRKTLKIKVKDRVLVSEVIDVVTKKRLTQKK